MMLSNAKNAQHHNSVERESIDPVNALMNRSAPTSRPTNTVSMFIMTDKVVMKNADVIRGQLMSEIEQGAIRWVIDLRLTQYMDSSGLAILIAAWKKVENLGGAMVLAEPTPTVKALLELTRLHELFEIYEDIDAAAEYVKRELR